VVITGCILLFGRSLMSIFTNTQELVELSMRLMSILAIGYIAMAVMQSLSGIMRGAGDTVTPMWISIFMTVVLRVPLAYGLCWLTRSELHPNGRQECMFISLLLSWVIGTVITAVFYKKGRWKKALTE
jgi:Na+-driven multidrug efflux pump